MGITIKTATFEEWMEHHCRLAKTDDDLVVQYSKILNCYNTMRAAISSGSFSEPAKKDQAQRVQKIFEKAIETIPACIKEWVESQDQGVVKWARFQFRAGRDIPNHYPIAALVTQLVIPLVLGQMIVEKVALPLFSYGVSALEISSLLNISPLNPEDESKIHKSFFATSKSYRIGVAFSTGGIPPVAGFFIQDWIVQGIGYTCNIVQHTVLDIVRNSVSLAKNLAS